MSGGLIIRNRAKAIYGIRKRQIGNPRRYAVKVVSRGTDIFVFGGQVSVLPRFPVEPAVGK
jgi:hypothetical protein